MSSISLVVTTSTWFKKSTKQSSELSDDMKVWVEKGKQFPVHSHTDVASLIDGHIRVALATEELGTNTWYVFNGHVELQGTERPNDPVEARAMSAVSASVTEPPNYKVLVTIPGVGSVDLFSPIYPGSNFTWDEATRGGQRLPVNSSISNNIIKAAQALDGIRAHLGNQPLKVTSWYRPPAINAAVGGVSNSTHIDGHGVDFYHSKLSTQEAFDKLWYGWWGNRGGLAPSYRHGFIHMDLRGYRATWHY